MTTSKGDLPMAATSVATKVYLLKRPRKVNGKTVHFHYLRWSGSGGRQFSESLGRFSRMTKTEAKKLRQAKEADLNSGAVPVDRGTSMTLGDFRPFYRQHRSRGDAPQTRRTTKRYAKLCEGTITDHDMCLRYLIQHFGESHRIDQIDELAAESWHTALADGELNGARADGWGDKKLSENTLRSKVRAVKAIFGWAKTYKIIRSNPFADFTGAGIATPPNPYVTIDDYRKLCGQATHPWVTLFSLCRLAGLRLDEARKLPWSGSATDLDGRVWTVGVDFDAKRISVCGKGGRFRQIPIVPELYTVLLRAFDEAPAGDDVRVCHPVRPNVQYALERFCKAAGIRPWRKPVQSLRSSWENDLKNRGVPEATYLSWLGHSLEVSRRHYVAPTPSEFDSLTAD